MMRKKSYKCCLLLFIVVFMGCGILLEEEYEEVARVGSESITWGDIKEKIRHQPLAVRAKASQSEQVALDLLYKMIENKILVQRAKSLGFTATEEEMIEVEQRSQTKVAQRLAQEFSGFDSDMPSKREEDFLESREAMEDQILIEKLLHSQITEEKIKQYFDDHKEEFSGPDIAVMKFIVVSDPILFEEIDARLNSGQDIDSIVKEFSKVPGFRSREDRKPVDAFRRIGVPMEQIKIGEVTKTKLPKGLSMFIYLEAILNPYEQAHTQIYSVLYDQLLKELKEKTPVKIKKARFKELALSKPL